MLKYFPMRQDVFRVYAVISFMLYSWMAYTFFWSLPAWLKFMTAGQIFSLLCYVVTASFIESGIFLLLLLGLCPLIPARFYKDIFSASGTAAVISILGWLMSRYFLSIPNPIGWVVVVFLVLLSASNKAFGAFLFSLSERMTVFLYITIPLSLLSLAVVVTRNIF